VDLAEVFAAVDFDDHGRASRERLFAFPEEEFLAVAFEGDLDEVGHG
jgi:hypothetical protein